MSGTTAVTLHGGRNGDRPIGLGNRRAGVEVIALGAERGGDQFGVVLPCLAMLLTWNCVHFLVCCCGGDRGTLPAGWPHAPARRFSLPSFPFFYNCRNGANNRTNAPTQHLALSLKHSQQGGHGLSLCSRTPIRRAVGRGVSCVLCLSRASPLVPHPPSPLARIDDTFLCNNKQTSHNKITKTNNSSQSTTGTKATPPANSEVEIITVRIVLLILVFFTKCFCAPLRTQKQTKSGEF